MVVARDMELPDGRVLQVHDSAPGDTGGRVFLWHHGTLRDGNPPPPFVTAAARIGARWISVSRPGHGRSTVHPGRSVGSIAPDVASVADELGVERFAVAGHSGGAPHALACAALLSHRVVAAVVIGSFAPRDMPGLDWYAQLDPAASLSFHAAEHGREHKLEFERTHQDLRWFLPDIDREVLAPEYGWFTEPGDRTTEERITARCDDHIALVSPWGFDLAGVACPTILLHGEADRFVPASHARAISYAIPDGEPWVSPEDGHFSILRRCDAAVEWVARHFPDRHGPVTES